MKFTLRRVADIASRVMLGSAALLGLGLLAFQTYLSTTADEALQEALRERSVFLQSPSRSTAASGNRAAAAHTPSVAFIPPTAQRGETPHVHLFTAPSGQAIRLVIPAINVDTRVTEVSLFTTRQGEREWQVAAYSAGHSKGAANPGENGNVVLAGHDDIAGEVFRDLELLHGGEKIYVYTGSDHAYLYTVTQQRVVLPTAVEVMAPTSSPVLTLITCTPYFVDTYRLIIRAKLTDPTTGQLIG